MRTTPDYEKAAIKAAETLIKYNIRTAPVMPLPIFKQTPGVLVLSFAEMSDMLSVDRNSLVTMFGAENQDAVTSVHVADGKLKYLVSYNQRLPIYMVQRSLARELGHIVLQHDGSLPEDVRIAEAKCFSKHLLCPRAVIHALQTSGIPLTVEAVGVVTGCYERCMKSIRNLPGVHVPAELNKKIREQFSDYIDNFIEYQSILVQKDESQLADFGDFMVGYDE